MTGLRTNAGFIGGGEAVQPFFARRKGIFCASLTNVAQTRNTDLFAEITGVVGDGLALKQICARFDAPETFANQARTTINVSLAAFIAKGGVGCVEGGTRESSFAGDGNVLGKRAILVFFRDGMTASVLAHHPRFTKLACGRVAFFFVIRDLDANTEGAFVGGGESTRYASVGGVACTFTTVFTKLVASRCCGSDGKLRGHANLVGSAFVVCIVAFFVQRGGAVFVDLTVTILIKAVAADLSLWFLFSHTSSPFLLHTSACSCFAESKAFIRFIL